MATNGSWTMVDTIQALKDMIDELSGCREQTPDLFMDLEGENLSRTGTLSILQILLLTAPHVYLIDCLKLGKDAFETRNENNTNLRDILESCTIKKAIFDVRNDSAALYHQYGISLAGMDDIQLMEVASRTQTRPHLSGLARCIEYGVQLSSSDRRRFLELKKQGQRLFDPNLGGSYAVFGKRPLDEEVIRYCVQDVCILPAVWNAYSKKLNSSWRTRMLAETEQRIQVAKSLSYNSKGSHMALCPNSWRNLSLNIPSVHVGTSLVLEDANTARCLSIMSGTFVADVPKSVIVGEITANEGEVKSPTDMSAG